MDRRGNPDLLLAEVQAQETRAAQGRLKIFLGACPGVGKTYTMLEAARARRADGVDVLVGLAETHGREETARLLAGLDILPRHALSYRGTTLLEFDLDAALARRPALLLVDELAHSNAPGSRHTKRWGDIEELLGAGIDVYTTMNVQHLESLNDVVAQITGVTVRETVPDAVLERADEIELVDVSPDVLLQRLREGKVYLPEQAARAVDRFFRRGNLIALRELALRRTAERVDAQMRGYMRLEGIREVWPTTERLLVCVGPAPVAARVLRAAHSMAASLHAPWVALYVESPAHERLSPADREMVAQHLRLAESLGAEAATVQGERIADEVLSYARQHNITKIVVGKPARPTLWTRLRGGLLTALVRQSGTIDVYVVTGEGSPALPSRLVPARQATPLREYVRAAGIVALTTILLLPLRTHLKIIDVAMLFLLEVVIVGTRFSQPAAVLASVLTIAAFDFLFVRPYGTLDVSDSQYFLSFLMMLVVALVMSRLTARIRRQAETARERERRTATLYAMSRELAATADEKALAGIASRHMEETLDSTVAIVLPGPGGDLIWPGEGPLASWKERSVARWAYEHRLPAGASTDTLPAASGLYLPLTVSGRAVGIAGVWAADPSRLRDPVQRRLLETFAGQAAIALERARLAERNRNAQMEIEAERLRSSLLSSLSHDLRTPLGSIEGAASSLLQDPAVTGVPARRELAETILQESQRMTRLVGNLLNMMRLETGTLGVHKEWLPLEEVIGVALLRLGDQLQQHPVEVHLPDMLLVPVDGLLMEQVFINLLENAARYTPEGTPIEITARKEGGDIVVSVADRGPGIPPDEEETVFDKFHRASTPGAAAGTGLGLTICRGILRAHGGRIWAEPRPGGGGLFRFAIPLAGAPPLDTPVEAAEV